MEKKSRKLEHPFKRKADKIATSLSIRKKLLLVFVATTLFTLAINVILYININRITKMLDEIYASNIKLNDMEDSLTKLQDSVTMYLNTKSTDAMEDYYKKEQEYAQKVAELNVKVNSNPQKRMERNIANMSLNYLELTSKTVEAKRGRNVGKYREYYEQAEELYGYLETYLRSLNTTQFASNTDSYEALSGSLQSIEVISIFIFMMLVCFNVALVVLVTNTITRPLHELSVASDRVASGNLFQVDVVKVYTMDEIGVVTVAFNQMLVSIRDYIERIRESMENERIMKENELKMETHLKDAQLKYLQAQINPHFLFNTLNAGAQLAMMESADRTYDYIQNVAAFFRYNIKKDNDVVSLADEIKLVDNYIYILNVRFSGDIHFEKDIDESLIKQRVPGMLLQPLVENSVNYGIRNVDWEGKIKLSVFRREDNVCIQVWDNGIGMSEEKIQDVLSGKNTRSEQDSSSNGVGLTNVIDRLELFFNEEGLLKILSDGEGKGTTIEISVPMDYGLDA